MRGKILSSLLLVGSLAVGSAAMAASTSTVGTIKMIDAKAMSLTLQDGTTYKLPAGFKAGALKAGEKVTVAWDMQGKEHVATKVTPAG